MHSALADRDSGARESRRSGGVMDNRRDAERVTLEACGLMHSACARKKPVESFNSRAELRVA